jgi:3-methyladenine DNA glycosylase Tag
MNFDDIESFLDFLKSTGPEQYIISMPFSRNKKLMINVSFASSDQARTKYNVKLEVFTYEEDGKYHSENLKDRKFVEVGFTTKEDLRKYLKFIKDLCDAHIIGGCPE